MTKKDDDNYKRMMRDFPSVTEQNERYRAEQNADDEEEEERFERVYDDLPAQCLSNIDAVIALLQEMVVHKDHPTDRARWGAYLAGEAAREALHRLEKKHLKRENVHPIGGVS